MDYGMYDFAAKVNGLYKLLQDDLSRDVFNSRIIFEADPNVENLQKLVTLSKYHTINIRKLLLLNPILITTKYVAKNLTR